jgi:hypothetical protein
MTIDTAAINALSAPEIDVQVYDTISAAAGLARAASDRIKVVVMARDLSRANKSLAALFGVLDDAMTGKKSLSPGTEPITVQRLNEIIDNLAHTSRIIDHVQEMMRRARLANNPRFVGAVRTLEANNERLKDVVDWLDAIAKPDELKIIFERADREKERGELYDLPKAE